MHISHMYQKDSLFFSPNAVIMTRLSRNIQHDLVSFWGQHLQNPILKPKYIAEYKEPFRRWCYISVSCPRWDPSL